jgi:ABC-2 type transport system permease protein
MVRLKALLKKEFLQIKRDKSALLIAFVLPAFLTFIFGYGISIDTNKIKIGIAIEDVQSVASSELVGFFSASKFVEVKKITRSQKLLENDLLAQKISAIVIIPNNFNKKLIKEKIAQIYLINDASEPNTAAFSNSYVNAILDLYAANLNSKKGIKTKPLIKIEERFWYNESLKADHLLNIGSIGFVLSIAGTLLTALVVARDWERGSMEYLIATPATIFEMILSKILPYLLLGLCSFFISFACVMIFFGTPFKGSLILFGAIGVLYLILTCALGLLISTASKSQFVASQGAILVSMVPTIMLSGLVYEIDSMPKIMQFITKIVPAKYLISAMRTLFLMGNEWSILLPNIFGIITIASVILFGVFKKTKKSID